VSQFRVAGLKARISAVKQSTSFRFILLAIVLCVEFVVQIGIDFRRAIALGVVYHAFLKVRESNTIDDRLFGGLLNREESLASRTFMPAILGLI
jgi:hypothetical protein